MKGNHGMEVPAWMEISVAAVKLKIGAPAAQIKGREYTLGY